MSFDPHSEAIPAAACPSALLLAQLRDYELSSALRHGVHTVVNQVHPGCRLDCAAMSLLTHILASMARRLLLPSAEVGEERAADVMAELKAREEAASGTPPPNSLERWDEIVFDRLLRDRVSQLVSGKIRSIALGEIGKATPRGRTRAQWRDVEPRSEAEALDCMRACGFVLPAPLTPMKAEILAALRLPHLMRQHVAAFLEFITAELTEPAGMIAMMTEADGYDRTQAEADVKANEHRKCPTLQAAPILSSAHLSLAIRCDAELLSMMQRLGGDALEQLQLHRPFDQWPSLQPIESLFPRTFETLDQLYQQFAWFHRSDAEIHAVLNRWLSGRIPLSPLAAMGIRPVSWLGRSCFPALLRSSAGRYSFPRHESDAEWAQASAAGLVAHKGPLVCIAFDLIDACGREFPMLMEHGRNEGAFWDRDSRLKLGEWTAESGFAFASGVAVAEYFAAFVPRERKGSNESTERVFAQLSADDANLWQQAQSRRSQSPQCFSVDAASFASTLQPISRVVSELLFLIHRAAHREVGSAFSSACPLDFPFQRHHPAHMIRLFSETQLRVAFDSDEVGRRDIPQVLIELIASYAPVDLPDLPLHTAPASCADSTYASAAWAPTGSADEVGLSASTPSAEFVSSVRRLQSLLEDAPNFPFRG